MVRITAYIKPHRLEPVKTAVAALGISGMSVGDVRGTGNSLESTTIFTGPGVFALPIRARIDVVVPNEMAEAILDAIVNSTFTGEADDGKVFIEEVEDAVRIRTGERGDAAV